MAQGDARRREKLRQRAKKAAKKATKKERRPHVPVVVRTLKKLEAEGRPVSPASFWSLALTELVLLSIASPHAQGTRRIHEDGLRAAAIEDWIRASPGLSPHERDVVRGWRAPIWGTYVATGTDGDAIDLRDTATGATRRLLTGATDPEVLGPFQRPEGAWAVLVPVDDAWLIVGPPQDRPLPGYESEPS